jgi:ataxia telangiectasia mutated family protein
MVGHIVGLGDRHCQNIMIDHRSGELVHIDLNMIFEIGRKLRIPEVVPFRLTPDIIHGMGPVGLVAGFSHAAEETLGLLRDRHSLVLMIMEVFKYDPINRWTSLPETPLPVDVAGETSLFPTHVNNPKSVATTATLALQTLLAEESDEGNLGGDGDPAAAGGLIDAGNNGESSVNKEAERALLRVKEKLLGIEESSASGLGGPLSPRGQVAHLVSVASNLDLLALMYPGWQPWM